MLPFVCAEKTNRGVARLISWILKSLPHKRIAVVRKLIFLSIGTQKRKQTHGPQTKHYKSSFLQNNNRNGIPKWVARHQKSDNWTPSDTLLVPGWASRSAFRSWVDFGKIRNRIWHHYCTTIDNCFVCFLNSLHLYHKTDIPQSIRGKLKWRPVAEFYGSTHKQNTRSIGVGDEGPPHPTPPHPTPPHPTPPQCRPPAS